MINNEDIVFDAVSVPIRTKFNAYVIGMAISKTPPKFPALSIVLKTNETNSRYSTFDNVENIASEEYELNAYSNLSDEKKAKEQVAAIIADANDILAQYGYKRTFYNYITNAIDTGVMRLCARFKNSIIEGE